MTTHSIILCYIIGCFIIGLPMAALSATFYMKDESFDWSRWRPVLKPIRNAMYPVSFLLSDDNRNFRSNYNGLIREVIDSFDPQRSQILFYVVLASLLWPARLFISVCIVTLFVAEVIITSPFMLLRILYKAIIGSFKTPD